jgi:hypothetical protein
MVFYWYYVNDLHTTHAVVCWVTALLRMRGVAVGDFGGPLVLLLVSTDACPSG